MYSFFITRAKKICNLQGQGRSIDEFLLNLRDIIYDNLHNNMSKIVIKTAKTKSDLVKFIRFNWHLYKDSPYAVPDFLEDTMDTFDTKKNAAFDFCDAEWFMAYRDGKLVGKVVAIINKKANEIWDTKNVRFGWIDFIDDREVSKALIDAVSDWGRQHGMTHIVGPLGFTDMDPEGMLVEGFEEMGNMSTIYNYPYYVDHIRDLGFEPEATWVQRCITVPKKGEHGQFDKFARITELVKQKHDFRLRKFKNKKEIYRGNYVEKIFHIINSSYKDLYGYSEMTDRQVNQLAKTYLQYLDLRLLSIVETKEGEPIGVGIGMGSVSEAIRKAHGKLLPFGWWHMVKGLFFNKSKDLELLLYGVLPEYRDTGCIGVVFCDYLQTAIDMGFEYAHVMPQLETNIKGQSTWKSFESRINKRRMAWKKEL